MTLQFFSCNVNGMNSPEKRRQIFQKLKKQKLDLICLQETHIKMRDSKYLLQERIGKLFHASDEKKKKKGLAVYVKPYLNPRLIKTDKEGRFLMIEIQINRKPTICCAIYAPNDNKERNSFFRNLREELSELEYPSIFIIGDYNGVAIPSLDKKSLKTRKDKRKESCHNRFSS